MPTKKDFSPNSPSALSFFDSSCLFKEVLVFNYNKVLDFFMSTLLIQGGTIIDGSGNERFTGDLLVENGIIKSVSKKITSHANRKINADGLLVTPGWVDIHTHYDGQITWDKYVTPSSWHGVSTVVMGNCGVGFAPVKKNNENFLIKLMEGVEDIPETVLAEE